MEQERFADPAAEALAIGAELAARRPAVAHALLEGRLDPETAMVLCEALDLLRPDADAEGQLVAAACAMTLDELDAWVDDLADATGPLGDPPRTCTRQLPSPARPAPAGGLGATHSLRPAVRALTARPPALTGTAARRRARSLAGPGRPPTAGREDSMT